MYKKPIYAQGYYTATAGRSFITGFGKIPYEKSYKIAHRGKVSLWSIPSRRRLLQTVASLDWSGQAYFTTLTYHICPGSMVQAKKDLAAFRHRLNRQGWTIQAVWKMEFQRRSVIHYHIVYNDLDVDLKEFRQWVRLNWHQVIAKCSHTGLRATEMCCKDWKGYQAGTQVDNLLMARDPALYFVGGEWYKKSKEYQHILPADFGTGRWWGLWGWKENWDTRLTPKTDENLTKRILRRYSAHRRYKISHFGNGENSYKQLYILPPTVSADKFSQDVRRAVEIWKEV